MKNTITLFIVFAFSISSLLAQDLNFENIQKEKKTKQNMKFKFGVSPSVSYIPVLPSIGNNYSVLTADYNYLTQHYDSISTLSSNTDLSSKILMNFGVSLKYNINKKIYLAFHPFFSIYKPKTSTFLNIDDQTNNPLRPQWDTTISLKKTNYIGLPISLGLQLNSKFSIEIGAQYLLSSTPPPTQTLLYTFQNSQVYWKQKTLRNLLPISGLLVFNYNLSKRITFKFGMNFGRSFYFPNTISIEDNIYYVNQNNIYSVYQIKIHPKEKISYCNYTMTTGICFSF